ncbi:putative ribonuclease H-like domain-containing protein [Tanacetum coccineum]|uniref:Ribonuclease H-like domain-containing protein n=1 Tax=Tanacetum coccineum TaxID=301880 RepID=A0ABQ5FE75_9ASTR
MCDKKNSVLFTDTACFVMSPDFKLPDESQVLLKVPRKNNMYSVDMKNIFPKESLTCLVAKATLDESMLWHRRLGHINFNTINKLVKNNLVRGLPAKRFENDQTYVACLKGKQHKASCKSKIQNSVTQSLFMLHMDLFGLTFVSTLMNKKYCLVVTNDYSRFTWVFFLASKDETSGILKNFITKIENLVDKKVKIIRCYNGTEFKNRVMNDFCKQKGIKREFSNRVIIVKPHNKTPYELFRGRTPALSFMRPFGCHVTILNTLDHLGKFDGKSDDGFFVGYSLTSKAFRVYNIRSRKVEENLHIRFLENKPIVTGDGPKWLFDINSLTKSMTYVSVVAGTNSNDFAGSEESNGAGHTSKEIEFTQDYIVMPLWKDGSMFDSSSKNSSDDEPQSSSNAEKKDDEGLSKASGFSDQVSATLEATHADLFGDKTKMDMSNLTTSYQVPTTPNTRIHKDHSLDHVIGDIQSGVQTRGMIKNINEHSDPAWVEAMQEELLQFKLQKVWILVNFPKARIEAIRLFLAYASFMGFMVYQMDVKSTFLYGTIKEEVYVCQPLGFKDPDYPDKVYKVVKALYGLHQAPRAYLDISLYKENHRNVVYLSKKQTCVCARVRDVDVYSGDVASREDGIFISQDKYVAEILRKFGFTYVRTAITPMDIEKPLLKESDGDDVDVHLYRSMIGSLMYLTSSRPDIMYLKGQPKLGLWYPRNSPFDLVAYSDSDYAGASLDRKSTTGGCQFLGCRLISWQCKKQTVVATSSTEAEYVAAASCCGQEVDINKKTENQAKMTKLSMEWKRLCKIKAKVQKCQSQSQYRRISSQTGAGTEEYY